MPKQTTNTGNASKSLEKNFTLTDEETALLVQVIIDYKRANISKSVDWETIRNKCEEITNKSAENVYNEILDHPLGYMVWCT